MTERPPSRLGARFPPFPPFPLRLALRKGEKGGKEKRGEKGEGEGKARVVSKREGAASVPPTDLYTAHLKRGGEPLIVDLSDQFLPHRLAREGADYPGSGIYG